MIQKKLVTRLNGVSSGVSAKRVGCAHGEQKGGRYARQNRIYQRPGQRDGYLFAQIAGAFFLRAGIAHGEPANGQQHKTFNGKSLAR